MNRFRIVKVESSYTYYIVEEYKDIFWSIKTKHDWVSIKADTCSPITFNTEVDAEKFIISTVKRRNPTRENVKEFRFVNGERITI